MGDLIYKEPVKPWRPFRRGDAVEVLDRDHSVISVQRVIGCAGRRVLTECGRQWTQDGWWLGDDRAWPFPSIRLKPCEHKNVRSGNYADEGYVTICDDCGFEPATPTKKERGG